MNISFSIASRDRQFSKKIRAIRPAFHAMFEEFSAIQLDNPIHEGILLGLTDSQPGDFLKSFRTGTGFFKYWLA